MAKKVMVGLSGGVDSAVTARVLLDKGFCVTGANCRFFSPDTSYIAGGVCGSADQSQEAALAAESLGIPFELLDFERDFSREVIDRFVWVYVDGGTPNPCIDCNRNLKFGAMLELALKEGFDFIATGHYAQIEYDESKGRYLLKKGADEKKDQSYVLYTLTQHQLAHTLFPLGGMTKQEVRAFAEKQGLVSAKKHDSQDICFIPDGDYAAFIERYTGKTFPTGNYVDVQGRILGPHKGIIRYTIGQRRGLGIALQRPMYVLKKNTADNTVTLCDNEELFSRELYAGNINLISVESITEPMRVKAKVRYKHTEQWATVTQVSEDRLHVVFDEPQRAIAKGQALVLYDGDIVVGGGTIE